MDKSRIKVAILSAIVIMIPTGLFYRAYASDHADTPAIAAKPGTDLTDVFLFPDPANANNVVLAMCVHPLIPTGQANTVSFDPNVLYQFKIDNTGDDVEDLVIQARFVGQGPTQQVLISGPAKPNMTGTQATLLPADPVTGTINQTFTTSGGIQVFAGPREDPFFFDLDQFFTIFPDRQTPLNGIAVADPDTPQATSWRPIGTAKDFLAGYNVLAIVLDLPKSKLIGTNGSKIGLWCTTSV